MKKSIYWFLLVTLFFVTASVLTACGSDTEPESSANVGITLSEETLSVEQYEEAILSATLVGAEGSVQWYSSDESIATVEGGTIVAKSVGNVIITAKYGDAEASCFVTVTAAGYLPYLVFEQTELNLLKGETAELIPALSYKGELGSIDGLTVVSSDGNAVAAEYSDGKVNISALSGTAEPVIVTAAYYWRSLLYVTAEISVSVEEDVIVSLDNASLELAVYDADGAFNAQGIYSAYPLSATVYYEGGELENPAIIWASANENIATVDANGIVSAVSVGEVVITAKYVTESGYRSFGYCAVKVGAAKIDLGDRKAYKNSSDGNGTIVIDGIEHFENVVVKNGAGEIIDILSNDILDFSSVDGGCYTLTIDCDGKVLYSMNVTVVTKVIKTADELINWYTYGTITDEEDPDRTLLLRWKYINGRWDQTVSENKDYTESYTVNGYFELGNNIDLTGKEVNKFTNFTANENTLKGLNGVFDGKGYTVTGGTYYEGGLFGAISSNGEVRDLALTGITLATANAYYYGTTASPFAESISGKLSNVLVKVAAENYSATVGTNNKALAAGLSAYVYGAKFENCVVVYPFTREGGAVVASYGTASFATNCYAIGTETDAYRRLTLTANLIPSGFTLYKTSDEVTLDGLDNGIWVSKYSDILFQSAFNDIFAAMLDTVETINTKTIPGGTITLPDFPNVSVSVTQSEYVACADGTITVSDNIVESFDFDLTFGFSVYGREDFTVRITVLNSVTVTIDEVIDYESYTSLNYDEVNGNYIRVANSSPATIDLSDEIDFDLPDVMEWSVNGNIDVSDRVTTDGKKFYVSFAGSGIYGDITLVGMSDAVSVTSYFHVVTAIINTADELINWADYGEITDSENPNVVKNLSYQWTGSGWNKNATGTKKYTESYTINGYFELGNNIDLTGKTVDKFVYFTSNTNTAKGLNGVFDGKGYTVSAGTYYEGGLFGAVSSTGEVKNIALTGITMSSTCEYYYGGVVPCAFAETISGKVTDVLVKVTSETYSPLANGAQITGGMANYIYGAIFNNCVVIYPFVHEASTTVAPYGTVSSATNCYAIGTDTDAYRRLTLTANLLPSGFTLYKASDTVTYSGLDTAIWLTDYSEIIFRSGFDGIYAEMVASLQDAELDPTESVDLVSLYNVSVFVEESEYVTVTENTVTASNSIPETFILHVVYDFSIYGKDNVIVNITVNEGSVAVYGETVNYEIYTSLAEDNGVYTRVKGADATVDLSEIISKNISDDIVWSIGETNVTNNVTASGKTLTVDFASIGHYGDFVLKGQNATVSIQIPFHVVTAFIETATELIHWKAYADEIENGTTGYFELANNIDLGGAQLNVYDADTNGGTSGEGVINKGFNGTFDGKGYTVYNGIFQKYGLFGMQIGINGTVKNLAMIKMTAGCDNTFSCLLTSIMYGKLENCLLEISGRTGIYPGGGGANVTTWAAGTYENVVFYNDLTDYYYFGMSQYIGWNGYTPVTGSRTNVYSIGGKEGRAHDKMFGNYANAYAAGTTCATLGLADKGFDADTWNFNGAKARFSSYTEQ